MSDKSITQQVQEELEHRVRTAVLNVLNRGGMQDVDLIVNYQVEGGKRAVAALLREPVDVEALAVGTTFRAPHKIMRPEYVRLWVRTYKGIRDMEGNTYLLDAVDPKKVRAVQPPAEDEA